MSGRRRRRERATLDTRLGPRIAEDVVGADVAIFVLGRVARVLVAPLVFQVQQLLRFLTTQVRDVAELFGQHQHAAIGIKDLGPPVRLFDRFAVADRTMVGQDHDIGSFHERNDRVGKRLVRQVFRTW